MKYELEKEEFMVIHATLKEMFSMTLEMVKIVSSNSHSLALKRLELDRRKLEFEEVKAGFRHVQDEEFEDRSEDSEMGVPLEEVSAIPFPPQEVHESPPPATTREYPDEQLTDDEMDALYSFLSTWLQNFNEEGPQPDRADLIRQYASDKRMRGVLKGLNLYGGLTQTVQVYLKGTDHPKKDDKEFPFFVASNICSVTSLVFPPLAAKFEYVNPLI